MPERNWILIDRNEEGNLNTLRVECFRHALSAANCGLRTNGDPSLIPLSSQGEAQAQAMAGSHPARPDMIISSPMVRALSTALPTRRRSSQ